LLCRDDDPRNSELMGALAVITLHKKPVNREIPVSAWQLNVETRCPSGRPGDVAVNAEEARG